MDIQVVAKEEKLEKEENVNNVNGKAEEKGATHRQFSMENVTVVDS